MSPWAFAFTLWLSYARRLLLSLLPAVARPRKPSMAAEGTGTGAVDAADPTSGM